MYICKLTIQNIKIHIERITSDIVTIKGFEATPTNSLVTPSFPPKLSANIAGTAFIHRESAKHRILGKVEGP